MVAVYECSICGRLWVGELMRHDGPGYDNDGVGFNQGDRDMIGGINSHAPPSAQWPPRGAVRSCQGLPRHVERPEVVAAFYLHGRAAAEEMIRSKLSRW